MEKNSNQNNKNMNQSMGMPMIPIVPMGFMPMMPFIPFMPPMGQVPQVGGFGNVPFGMNKYIAHEVNAAIENPVVIGMERPKMAKATRSREDALTIVLNGILPGFKKEGDLFEQGLTSFNTMQMVTRCGEQGYSITMVDIYRNPTFKGIVECMKEGDK